MMEFEQIAPMLYTICSNYAKRMHYKYSRDELINAVWARGKVHKLTNPRYLSRRIAHDCVEYIREQERSRRKFRIKWKSLDETPWFLTRKAVQNGTKAVVDDDTWRFLLKGLSSQDALITRLVAEGHLHREAAEVVGLSQAGVTHRIQKCIRPHLKERLKLLDEDVR